MAEATDASLEYYEDSESEHGTSSEYVDPWCDVCYDRSGDIIRVDVFCPECNRFLCSTCNEHHRLFPILKDHKTLREGKMPKSQSDKPVKYPDCTMHAGAVKDHYCTDCGEMICSECMKQTHANCRSSHLSVVCKGVSSIDIHQFGTLVDSLKQNVFSTKSALENNINDIENQKDDLIKQAKEERDKLISNAEKLFDNTVSMISDVCKQRNAYVAEQLLTLENIIHSLDETTCDIGKTLNITFDQNVFIRMQQIVGKVREYKSEIENINTQIKTISLTFLPSSETYTFLSVRKYLGDVKQTASQLGDLQSLPKTVFPQTSALSRKTLISTNRSDISQIDVNKMPPLDIRLKHDKETCSAAGTAITSNNTVLVSDRGNKSVKAFSQNNRLLSCLTFSDWLYGISVINDQTAAVSTYDNKLHILNISDPTNIFIDRSLALRYWVVGMTQYKNNLIVTRFDMPQCVKMIDLNGQEKWSISVDHKGQRLFDKPYSVTITTANDTSTVIVSDWCKETLTLIDPNDGHLMNTIYVKGKSPHGVTSDNKGNVYICYYNTNEIYVYSPDFKTNRKLLSRSDLFGSPRDIVYDGNRGVLYISYVHNDTVDCFRIA